MKAWFEFDLAPGNFSAVDVMFGGLVSRAVLGEGVSDVLVSVVRPRVSVDGDGADVSPYVGPVVEMRRRVN